MRSTLILLLATTSTSPVLAQATLVGRAHDDSTKAPVEGAEVVVEGSSLRTRTGADGRFTLGGVPARIGFVLVRKVGYRPIRVRMLVFGDDTLEVDVPMRRGAVELEPILVTAAAVPPGMLAFAERRATGLGAFIDWHVLREQEHLRLADLFRSTRGVRIIEANQFSSIAVGRRQCAMALWVDGIPLYRPGTGMPVPNLNDFPIAQLEAVEVYRGPAETPAFMSGAGTSCGTIVLWSRRR